jgi:hypothetical protein
MKRCAIAGLILFASAAAWVFVTPHSPEPVYLGKPLRYWLRGYGNYSWNESNPEFADALVRYEGTNAIPVLLEMIASQDSALDIKLLKWSHTWRHWAQKQHFVKVFPAPHLPGDEAYEAAAAFRALGPEAVSAVPGLIKLLNQNLRLPNQSMIELVVGEIGPAARQAVPVLLTKLHDPNSNLRGNALYSLGRIHAAPELVMPRLMKALEDSDSYARLMAALALEAYGVEVQTSDPWLAAKLQGWNLALGNHKKIEPDPDGPLESFPETLKTIVP